jgi:hypothetical protein
MSALRLQQKCPMCPEMLDYEVLPTSDGRDDSGNAQFTIKAQTTPESTAHVWTHAPKEES